MLNHILKFIALSTFMVFSNLAHALLVSSGSAYLHAETGDYVGGGLGASEVTWTHGEEGLFSIETSFDQGARIVFDDGNYWSFEFSAPTYDPITNTNNGNPLEIGFYNHATRSPFNSPTRPGMDFSGNGRGNNQLGGWFDVLAIEYGAEYNILSLAVDFRQFSEEEAMLGASTFGSLRINSDVALNYSGEALSQVPVPMAVWLFGSGLITLIGVSKRKE